MTLLVKAPPICDSQHDQVPLAKVGLTKGPATEAMPYIPPIIPKKIGRFSSGVVCANVTSAPVKIPALPRPATARPTMRAVEFGATPHIRDPSSKMKRATRKTDLTLKSP